jgi:hypothetical protein
VPRVNDVGPLSFSLSEARFREAVVRAIDQHAHAIADLGQRIQQAREFMADVSVRLEQCLRRLERLERTTMEVTEDGELYVQSDAQPPNGGDPDAGS